MFQGRRRGGELPVAQPDPCPESEGAHGEDGGQSTGGGDGADLPHFACRVLDLRESRPRN
jgi:hypothetical protein